MFKLYNIKIIKNSIFIKFNHIYENKKIEF